MTRHHRKAAAFTAAGTGGLLGSAAASAFVGPALLPAFVAGGMVVFVFCGARALRLCGVDDIVFDPAMRRGRYAPPPVSAAPLRRKISRVAAVSRFAPRNAETHP
jgi:hypothetical protein